MRGSRGINFDRSEVKVVHIVKYGLRTQHKRGHKVSSPDQQYDIFLSYARSDNAPIPPGAPIGWVTALREHILADHRRFSTEPLRIFFDTHHIKDMDDWRHRILGALRTSRILLVCLSPSYFASFGKLRFKTEYEQELWSECSRLIANSIIFYNASILSRLLEFQERNGDTQGADATKGVSPIAWHNTNLHGRYEFQKQPDPLNVDAIVEGLTQRRTNP